MAGAGYKLFNTGDVLTAAQVNTYLMEQTVMVFASAAARTTALSGVLAEGMVSYLQDTNTLEVYNGSAWVGATGDITEVQAGTGISVASGTGPVPVVTNTVATTFDAKGDLVVGTGADTFAKLVVGNSGESIVADSSATTGLRWQSNYSAGKNKLINGDFGIWQRGTSGSVTNSFTYLTDRFWSTHNGSTNGTITISRQAFTAGQTDVPNNPLYFARITNTTLGTSQTQTEFGQFIEDVNTFAGQTVTFSFYVKASGTFTLQSWAWQGFGSGGSSSVFTGLTLSSSTTTTSWQRITATVTVPSVSGKTIGAGSYLGFYVRMVSPTAGSTIDFSNWQVEAGNVATAFQTATGTLAGELQAAQRYYQRVTPSQNTSPIALGYAYNTTVATITFPLKTTMRVAPTSVEQNAASVCSLWDQVNSSIQTTAVALNTVGPDNVTINCTVASGLTAFRPYVVFAGTSGYLAVSAEL